ncbi:unnamed protein product, partial [marine sediment metagenome]
MDTLEAEIQGAIESAFTTLLDSIDSLVEEVVDTIVLQLQATM